MLHRTPHRLFVGGAAALLLVFASIARKAPPTAQAADHKWAKRDAWQRPAKVMDALKVKPGSVVADVGCNEGYFTFHLARRVGPQGKVYAEDIDYKALGKVSARASKEHLTQVEVVLGAKDNPRLPAETLDAVLVVDAYHEMDQYDSMLRGFYQALKPGGLLGVIDRKAANGQPRSTYLENHTIPEELVREDAPRNGFQFLRQEKGFKVRNDSREYFFLVFRKP